MNRTNFLSDKISIEVLTIMKKLKFLRTVFKFRREAMLLLLFIVASFVNRSLVFAAFEEKIPAARPAGLGGGFVAVPNDANGIFYNPASLGGLPGANFSFSQTTLFNISDLPYMTFAGALPTRNLGTIGFGYSQFGPSFYKETEMMFSHSIALARKSYIGYNIRSQSVDIKNFGGTGALGVDIGIYSSILNFMSCGISAKNITNPTLGSTAEPLPQIYRIGVSYYPAVGVIFLLEMSKDMTIDGLSYHGGAEINLTKNFTFRTGVKTNPASYSIGLGAGIGIFKINYAMVSHPILDTQNIFSLGIRFGPEEDVAPAESPRRRATRTSTSRAKKTKAELYEELKDLKVNPNKATADELRKIPGVGALTAQRIIDYRDSSGGFRSADDLMNVPRMTKRTLEKIRPYLVFDESAPSVSETAPSKVEEKIDVTPKEKTPPPSRRRTEKQPVVEEEYPQEPESESAPSYTPPVPAPKSDKPKTSAPVEIPSTGKTVIPTPVVPITPSVAPAPTPKKVETNVPPPPPQVIEEKATPTFTEDMLDINTASAEELQVIGFTGAQARNIVRYRNKEGNFSSVDDLLKVPGVDAKTLDKVRDGIGVK